MARSKNTVTPQQVESMAAVLDVKFVPAISTSVAQCQNQHRDYHCPNRVTQFAQSASESVGTCSDSYCRINAAIVAHYGNLPAIATPRVRDAIERIQKSISLPIAS